MPKFSEKSKEKLKTCHPLLQVVLNKAITIVDFSVTDGIRDEETQNEYYNNGATQKQFPHSRHNRTEDPRAEGVEAWAVWSDAVDVMPYPAGYNTEAMIYIAGIIMAVAADMGIALRWGGDWKQLGTPDRNTSLFDPWHFELCNSNWGE